jgi:hypothetical protein
MGRVLYVLGRLTVRSLVFIMGGRVVGVGRYRYRSGIRDRDKTILRSRLIHLAINTAHSMKKVSQQHSKEM